MTRRSTAPVRAIWRRFRATDNLGPCAPFPAVACILFDRERDIQARNIRSWPYTELRLERRAANVVTHCMMGGTR